MSQYKFYYFPAFGRGEFIRYIFAYADVPYDNIIINRDEWFGGEKDHMPLGQVPLLKLNDGRSLSQSLAIGRYLASQHGLLSDDHFANALGDQAAGVIEDFYDPVYHGYVVACVTKQEDKMKTTLEEVKQKKVLPTLERLEKLLGNNQYFTGNKIHWSDLAVAELVYRVENVFDGKDLTEKFPKVRQHCQRIHEIPAIKKHVGRRPPFTF